tara:strand:+ start:3161 stop:3538 length:378 start_codon:yes stop_codon:yes gene_type:complete
MKATVLHKTLGYSFYVTYTMIKERIKQNGFLLLHEINTQNVVAKQGIIIPKLIQLLFFEPKYVGQIMGNDPLAINDIPLKFVIRSLGNGHTEVSFQDPVGNLRDYKLEGEMLNELRKRIDEILNF